MFLLTQDFFSQLCIRTVIKFFNITIHLWELKTKSDLGLLGTLWIITIQTDKKYNKKSHSLKCKGLGWIFQLVQQVTICPQVFLVLNKQQNRLNNLYNLKYNVLYILVELFGIEHYMQNWLGSVFFCHLEQVTWLMMFGIFFSHKKE